MHFYAPNLLVPLLSPTVFPFSSFFLLVGIAELGSLDLVGCKSLSPSFHCRPFLIIIIIMIINRHKKMNMTHLFLINY